MTETCFIADVRTPAVFSPGKAGKQDLFRSPRLFAGLNTLARGQSQATHAHDAMDKFYFVASGKARITIGEETQDVAAGGLAWAPAGIPHGIAEALEDCVILVAMGPAPGR